MALEYEGEVLLGELVGSVRRVFHRCPSGHLQVLGRIIDQRFLKRKRDRRGIEIGPWEKCTPPKFCHWCGEDLDWTRLRAEGWL